MTAITKTWTDIADAAIDPDSPVDQALMTAIRDNIIFVKEWIGESYEAGAIQDHNHDGVNSTELETGPITPKNASFESGLTGITFADSADGSHAVETTNVRHGAQAMSFTSVTLANGGSQATWDAFIPIAEGDRVQWRYWRYGSVANISCQLAVVWYEKDKTTVVSSEQLNLETATPTAYAMVDGVSGAAPANARFYRLQFIGGAPSVGTAVGTIYADGFAAIDLPRIQEYCIADAAINQVELKTTTGIVSTSNSIGVNLTLPGGEYGFYPQVRATGSGPSATAQIASVVISASYVTNIFLTDGGSGGLPVSYAQQRYIQASPPYDLGDGDIPVFMFAVVDNATKKVISTYIAEDPPWANNGPTSIRPDAMIGGKAFKRRSLIFQEYGTLKAAIADGLTRRQIFDRLENDPVVDTEITQAFKQADMPIIPHPFPGYDSANQTVIMLDPVSDFSTRMRILQNMNDDDFSFGNMLHKGYITFGNTNIGAKAPPGVMPVSANWKLTKR